VHYAALIQWNDSLTYVEYVGLVLITIVFAWSYNETFYSKLAQISMKNATAVKDREQLIYFLRLIRVIERCKSDDILYARVGWLYAAYHNNNCNLISCPLSKTSGICDIARDSKERKMQILKQCIALHFKQVATHKNASVDLKILYIAFLSRFLKNYVGAWFMISGLLVRDCSFVENFHIYAFKYFSCDFCYYNQ